MQTIFIDHEARPHESRIDGAVRRGFSETSHHVNSISESSLIRQRTRKVVSTESMAEKAQDQACHLHLGSFVRLNNRYSQRVRGRCISPLRIRAPIPKVGLLGLALTALVFLLPFAAFAADGNQRAHPAFTAVKSKEYQERLNCDELHWEIQGSRDLAVRCSVSYYTDDIAADAFAAHVDWLEELTGASFASPNVSRHGSGALSISAHAWWNSIRVAGFATDLFARPGGTTLLIRTRGIPLEGELGSAMRSSRRTVPLTKESRKRYAIETARKISQDMSPNAHDISTILAISKGTYELHIRFKIDETTVTINPTNGRKSIHDPIEHLTDGQGRAYLSNFYATGSPFNVTLPNLEGLGTQLENSQVRVCEDITLDRFCNRLDSQSLVPDYLFDESDERFSGVNSFYHTDRFLNDFLLNLDSNDLTASTIVDSQITFLYLPEQSDPNGKIEAAYREFLSEPDRNRVELSAYAVAPNGDWASNRPAGYSFFSDGDVVRHELSHWLWWRIFKDYSGLTNQNYRDLIDSFSGSFRYTTLAEGFADIFAQLSIGKSTFAESGLFFDDVCYGVPQDSITQCLENVPLAWNIFNYGVTGQSAWRSFDAGWPNHFVENACTPIPLLNTISNLSLFIEPGAERSATGACELPSPHFGQLSWKVNYVPKKVGEIEQDFNSIATTHGIIDQIYLDAQVPENKTGEGYVLGSVFASIIGDIRRLSGISDQDVARIALRMISMIPPSGFGQLTFAQEVRQMILGAVQEELPSCNCDAFLDDIFAKRNWELNNESGAFSPTIGSLVVAGIERVSDAEISHFGLPLSNLPLDRVSVDGSTATVSISATDNDSLSSVNGLTWALYDDTGSEISGESAVSNSQNFTVNVTQKPRYLVARARDRAGNRTAAVLLLERSDPPAEGAVAVSRNEIDIVGNSNAESSFSETFVIENVGGSALSWDISGTGSGISVSSNAGNLLSGAKVPITVTAQASVGIATRTLEVNGPGGPLSITINVDIQSFGSPGTEVVYANEDTFVSESSPSNSFGNSTSLQVQTSSFTTEDIVSLLRFDKGEFPGEGVLDAELVLYKTQDTTSEYQITISDFISSWSEGSTWNSLSSVIDSSDGFVTNKRTNVPTVTGIFRTDLTRFVNQWVNRTGNTIRLRSDDENRGDRIRLGSSEASSSLRPRIEFTPLRPGCDLVGDLDLDRAGADRNGNNIPEFFANTQLEVRLFYRNIGDGDCGLALNEVYLERSDGSQSSEEGSDNTRIIGPNESSTTAGDEWTESVSLPSSPGSYRLRLVVDVDDELSEQSEINNTFRFPFEVVAKPSFGFQPSSGLAATTLETTTTSIDFSVTNTTPSSPDLVWTASVDRDWLALSDYSGTSSNGSLFPMTVYVNSQNLSPGDHSGTVSFQTADGIKGNAAISLTVEPLPARLEVERDRGSEFTSATGGDGISSPIYVGNSINEIASYSITNGGTAPLGWEATVSSDISGLSLSANPATGSAPGTLRINADPSAVSAPVSGSVQVTVSCASGCTDDGYSDTFSLDVLRRAEVVTSDAEPVGATSATLNGTVNPFGITTAVGFEYGTDTTYGQIVVVDESLGGNTTQDISSEITGLQPETTYHFRAIADPILGAPIYGEDQTLVTMSDTNPPAAPDLMLPINGDIIFDAAPVLDWFDVSDASEYIIQLDDTVDFSSPLEELVVFDVVQISEYAVETRLEEFKAYYWRVIAIDGAGNESSWSDTWSFSVDQTVPDPDLLNVSISSFEVGPGEPISITITGRNLGAPTSEGALNASVVFSDGSDALSVSEMFAPWATWLTFASPGDSIHDTNCQPVTAADHMFEAAEDNWQNGEEHSMTFTVTPNSEGTLLVRARTTMRDDSEGGSCNYRNDTSVAGSLAVDQQGWSVIQSEVDVRGATPDDMVFEDGFESAQQERDL